MRFIGYNFVAVLLVLLAAYMVYADKPYYGWVIAAAVSIVVVPESIPTKK
jgi:hypothetical protein